VRLRPPRAPVAPTIHQLKITLRHIHPPIWRRFLVRSDTTLRNLHEVIQTVMGWTDLHLYQFIASSRYYGEPDTDFIGPPVGHAQRTLLRTVAPGKGSRLRYEYDFGDGWEHALLVEAVLPLTEGVLYPTCLTGRRACPPEDCGGPWGYGELLAALKDPAHEEHASMVEWLGGDFDPEAFDLQATNDALRFIADGRPA
jgi:hypothetical protein